MMPRLLVDKVLYHPPLCIILVIAMLLSCFLSYSQEKKRIDIEQADYLEADSDIAANAQRLVGNVRIRHKDILMWCDSAYTYTGTNRVDAFGNVHVNQGDTINLYAGKIFYNGDTGFARASKDVRLTNKKTILYTDTLDYNINANTGYYEDHGRIVDSTNILTSVIGKYYLDEELIYFYSDVNAYNDNYTLESDTLIYNTVTDRIFIEGPTVIRDSVYTLYSEDGWYDSQTGEAELLKNSHIYNDTQELKADYIKYNEKDGKGRASGYVRMEDFKNKTIVTGKTADYHDKIDIAMITDSALLMIYSEKDTLFLHADTLRSVPDTTEGEKIVKAYYGTKFYRSDIQGICDSLVYYSKDSVVELNYNPVIWSNIHQMSADNISMKQNVGMPDEIHLNQNGFIISKLDSGRFDQIKGREMTGYVVDNKLTEIDVDGNGQTLYYAREDSAIIGLNKVESSKISFRFKDDRIYRISFVQNPLGNLKPLFDVTEEEKKLSGFEWLIYLRPLSRYDIFEKKEKEPESEEKNEEKQEITIYD
jgi:lipopolysaccharide export system protein LptA